MENIIDPSVQEMMRDIEQPDREASPGLFDELLQNEGSRRSKGRISIYFFSLQNEQCLITFQLNCQFVCI